MNDWTKNVLVHNCKNTTTKCIMNKPQTIITTYDKIKHSRERKAHYSIKMHYNMGSLKLNKKVNKTNIVQSSSLVCALIKRISN